jgi:RecB family exonuclease
VLQAAGVDFVPGETALRPARLLAVLRAGVSLAHFPLDLLTSRPGWDEALARTIADLEAAGLRPEDLEGPAAAARVRDVVSVWQGLDESAGPSWTIQRIYLEAALTLEAAGDRWPYPGAVLVAAGNDTTAAEARFCRAIPHVTLGLLAARPTREHYLGRVEALFGRAAAAALRSTPAPRSSGTERDLLASYFFEPPPVLADLDRPRSHGPDGTVHLEEHAGVEAEIEAAADWVAREVMEGTPLEDIAVLVPSPDPLATLVAERLARLPWESGPLPVHVAGGLPLTGTASGARTLAVVRALRAHLGGAALADVLPALRTVAPDGRHLALGAATDLVWSLGAVGGNPANPAGALEWAARAAAREPDLAAQLEVARQAGDEPEQAGLARKARDLERLLADLRAVRPAIEALVGVARLVVARAPLTELWPALRTFLEEWLLQPGEGPRAPALLDERLSGAAADAACGTLAGDEALRMIEDVIASVRLPAARFGEPAVYVGTVREASSLPFRAVRVIGLAEGHLPPLPREDPVLPDSLRARIRAPGIEGGSTTPITAADRALDALHALDTVIRNTEARIVLSAPRLDVARSLREPASVLLEAAAALGRPNAATGQPGAPIPDSLALRRDAFAPGRRAAGDFRRRFPLGETAWQDAVALGALGPPSRWYGVTSLDLNRMAALRETEAAGALDGILGSAAADVVVPGLTPARPISPSALQVLLQCPHLFLLGNILGFDEPAAAPPQREIGQPAYGGLFHLVAEEFYRTHGTAFCARESSLDAWHRRADEVMERVFDRFLEQYPLVGGAVVGQQRERLRLDVHELIDYDWNARRATRFVAVERSFGRPAPLELSVDGRTLFVRGQIDRIDVDGTRTLVRDLKTGRAHPRLGKEAGPSPTLDIQLAVYALVTAQLASDWRVPRQVGAAYAYINRGANERAWRDDFHGTLEPAARQWLAVAADLLEARAFPRTTDANDCRYCRFRPVCGENVHERAGRVLAGDVGVLARFSALKQPAADGDD